MKRREFKNGRIKTIMEEFSNFNEFINVNNNRPIVWECNSRPARKREDKDFTGCESFEEAQELLLHGYNESVDRMIKTVNALQKSGEKTKTVRFADVCGYAPIVPNAIIGLPCSMMNQKKQQVKARVVTLVYDVNCAWYVTTQELLDYGCRVINCALNLERAGYRVKIDIASTFNEEGKRQYIMRVPLKNEDQPINIKRVSFGMSHAAMLRYLAFDWAERLPGSKHLSAFGRAIQFAPKCFENVKEVFGENEFLIHYGMDVEEMLSQNNLK